MLVTKNNISVREIHEGDFGKVVDYFLKSDKDFLLGMGVEISKLPSRHEWLKLLADEFYKPVEDKKFFYVIWLLNDIPVGHSNINKIIFGEEAYMHLHIWEESERQKGTGLEFVKLSLPYYFKNFRLKRLYCEPYALNPAPNKALEKLGFEFIGQHETTPGWISFRQLVNRWCLNFDKYQVLYAS